jgi:hypothetical protein
MTGENKEAAEIGGKGIVMPLIALAYIFSASPRRIVTSMDRDRPRDTG